MSFILDGIENSNSTNPPIETSVIFSAGHLVNGDHQLIGNFDAVDIRSAKDFAAVSHLECVAPLFHCLKSTPLKVSALLGLKIQLGMGSTLSIRGQMQ